MEARRAAPALPLPALSPERAPVPSSAADLSVHHAPAPGPDTRPDLGSDLRTEVRDSLLLLGLLIAVLAALGGVASLLLVLLG